MKSLHHCHFKDIDLDRRRCQSLIKAWQGVSTVECDQTFRCECVESEYLFTRPDGRLPDTNTVYFEAKELRECPGRGLTF